MSIFCEVSKCVNFTMIARELSKSKVSEPKIQAPKDNPMEKKYYITTSIAYVNSTPHIGYALECVQADAIARYHRDLLNKDVFFLTGTDEHGSKIERAATAVGKSTHTFVAENAARFAALHDAFNLSTDYFIRTSADPIHRANVLEIWNKLLANDDLYKKTYSGLYCVGHEAFVTEKDLDENGNCRDHKRPPEKLSEENWFFRLTKYQDQLVSLIEKDIIKIHPVGRKKEILNFLYDGLTDVSFSRPKTSLSWGIEVPGDASQVIYVWCDALVNYLYKKDFWPADLHVIGKDILRFHAVYWPAILLSAGLALPKELFVHGHITVNGEKMSKSIGNTVDPFELVQKFGTDPVRYFFLRENSPFEDGDYSEGKFLTRYEADLVSGIGNLFARVNRLKDLLSITTPVTESSTETIKILEEKESAYHAAFSRYELHEALGSVLELIRYADKRLSEDKPWETKDPSAVKDALFLLSHIARLLLPFLPETSKKIQSGETSHLFPRLSI